LEKQRRISTTLFKYLLTHSSSILALILPYIKKKMYSTIAKGVERVENREAS
jgi:hypothetical protein